MFWRDAHSQRWRVWKAAVRTSRLKHLLTCQLRLIRLSAMTHAVIISSGEDLFFSLWHIDLLGSHQRCAVKANINKHVKSSFLHFRITKALQISRWKLSVSYSWHRHAGHVLPSAAWCTVAAISTIMSPASSVTWRKSLLYWGRREACLCWSAHECDIWGKGGEACVWGGVEFKGEVRNWISLNGFLIHRYLKFLSKAINLMLRKVCWGTKT